MTEKGLHLDHVIELEVDEDALVDRITGRFTCARCNTPYHDRYKLPAKAGVCDVCGETEFKRRADDNEEAVRTRMAEYRAKTAPILPHYEAQGIVRRVDGMASVEAVSGAIAAILDGCCNPRSPWAARVEAGSFIFSREADGYCRLAAKDQSYSLPSRRRGVKPFEKKMAIGGLIVAVGSLGIAALEYTKMSAVPSGPPQELPPVRIQVEPVAPAPPARLPRLLTERTIGRQLQYFEQISGPPQEVHGNRRHYQVDGCDLEIELGTEQQIEALSLLVTGACSFEWRDMAHNIVGLGRPEQTTIEQFLDNVGESGIYHLGGCTRSCGNMAAPEIWLQLFGSHADGYIDVTVAVGVNSAQEVDGLMRLAALVEANLGEDATYDLTETCDRRVIGWIRSTMGSLRIERVELRTNMPSIAPSAPTSCDLTRL